MEIEREYNIFPELTVYFILVNKAHDCNSLHDDLLILCDMQSE